MAMLLSLIIAAAVAAFMLHQSGWGAAVVLGFFSFIAAASVLLRIFPSSPVADLDEHEAAPADASATTAASDPAAGPPNPPELIPAIDALNRGNYRQGIDLAAPFLGAERESTRADALRLTGMCHSRLEQFAEALPFWEALLAFEHDADAWLNLASTAAAAGHFDRALDAFSQYTDAYTAEVRGTVAGAAAFNGFHHANFLAALAGAGRDDLAMVYLDRLAGFYRSLGSTDSNYLYLRTMPFFSTFLENSLPIVRRLKSDDQVRVWYREIHDDVDPEGQALFLRYGVPH